MNNNVIINSGSIMIKIVTHAQIDAQAYWRQFLHELPQLQYDHLEALWEKNLHVQCHSTPHFILQELIMINVLLIQVISEI